MKRMNATLAGVVLVSLMFSMPMLSQQPPANVEGNWTIYSTSIQTGETVVKHVQIAQYGNSLTGYFEGPNQSGPIQGQVNGRHVVFSTVTRTVLTFRGQVYGDSMSGLYGIHGKHAPWQAVRPASVSMAVPPATGTVYSSQPVLASPESAAVAEPQPPAQAETVSGPQSSPAPTPAPLSPEQLNALVAPIALYPDALVAQVLAASTNPDQVAYADDWLAQNRGLTGAALAQAVDQQSWDPSVKALTQFPSVLDNLAHNLSWTSSLGQAFVNQQADVMAAVQAMRGKAQAAGTLQSTTQITVTQPSSTTIVIQPANPQVVYVPQYNPAVVYGAPVVVPLYVPPPVPVAAVGLYFGSGITIGATFGGGGWGGGYGWGWHAWNVNWGGGWGGGGGSTIIYNHNTYVTNNVWRNNNYNGYHPWGGGAVGTQNHGYYGPNGYYHPDPGYRPGTDTHYGPNGGYHPNGYYGPNGAFHHDVPGTNPNAQPNGGTNGNHGLIGGNGGTQNPNADQTNYGGVQHTAQAENARNGNNGGQLLAANRSDNNRLAGEQNRSRMSGDGGSARAEANRGRTSMQRAGMQRSAARRPAMHSQPAHSSGGERRR